MATIESASTVGIPGRIGSSGRPRRGITVHYNGGPLSRGSHSQCRAQVRSMHRYHKNIKEWAGLGYHYLVCHHGIVLTGRGLNRVGAHARGVNATRVGIQIMLGGSQKPTAAQLKGFRELRAWLRARGVRNSITGHRDHSSTSCPGSPLYARVRSGDWGSGGAVGGGGSMEEDPVIGLEVGDEGEAVKALQALIDYAGRGDALGDAGVDGDYGPKTAEALRLVREDVGSQAKKGWGDAVTGYAYAQLKRAVARAEARAYGGGGSVSVPDDLQVRSLTARELHVGDT